MAKRSYSDLRALSREPLDHNELIALLALARKDQPRGAALTVVAQLETALERALIANLPNLNGDNYKNLFGDYGPLDAFYPQIWLANALGLIGELTRNDLEEIRHMRNQFAHAARRIDFDTSAIAAHCEMITLPERCGHIVPRFQFGGWPPTNVRERFISSALNYLEAFMDIASGDTQNWPLD